MVRARVMVRVRVASFHALFARYTFAEQRCSVITPEGRQSEARVRVRAKKLK